MPRQSAATSKKTDAKPRKASGKAFISSGKGNAEERFHLISEAAYFRALGRGFDGGDTVEDWLMAEEQIEAVPLEWEDTDSRLAKVD